LREIKETLRAVIVDPGEVVFKRKARDA